MTPSLDGGKERGKEYMDLLQELMQLEIAIHMMQTKCNFLLVEEHRIHPGQIALLMTMKKNGPSSQRTLAQNMNCSPASVGVSVKRLEKAGLLEKQTDAQDLRITRVALTRQGMEFADKCEGLVNIVANRKYEGFCPEEIKNLEDYLLRIKSNLKALYLELTEQKETGADRKRDQPQPKRNAEFCAFAESAEDDGAGAKPQRRPLKKGPRQRPRNPRRDQGRRIKDDRNGNKSKLTVGRRKRK